MGPTEATKLNKMSTCYSKSTSVGFLGANTDLTVRTYSGFHGLHERTQVTQRAGFSGYMHSSNLVILNPHIHAATSNLISFQSLTYFKSKGSQILAVWWQKALLPV